MLQTCCISLQVAENRSLSWNYSILHVFDRLRGKNEGVTAILKYPLRLLAVQQLERVLTVIMKANIIREQEHSLSNTTRFALGFYVGKDNTPNRIDLYEN